MRNRNLALFRIALFGGTLAAVLAALEVAGQLAHRAVEGSWRLAASGGSPLMEPHPYLVARPRASSARGPGSRSRRITRAGRAPPADARGRVRIACIGGSTTFGVRVDDADTWPAILQARLGDGVAVRNYGVPGYSSAEHVIQMALVVNEGAPTSWCCTRAGTTCAATTIRRPSPLTTATACSSGACSRSCRRDRGTCAPC